MYSSVCQTPYLAPSNLNLSRLATSPFQLQGALRPYSVTELAERAKQSLDSSIGPIKPFNVWLRIAENAYRDAKSLHELGDLELAFVEYAKAATILLQKIPSHPDYWVLLGRTQRHNMGVVSYLCSLCLHYCTSLATTTTVDHVHVL